MAFDYRKLLGKIVEKYGTQIKFAEAMELSKRSLSLKLNGKVHFNKPKSLKLAVYWILQRQTSQIIFLTSKFNNS